MSHNTNIFWKPLRSYKIDINGCFFILRLSEDSKRGVPKCITIYGSSLYLKDVCVGRRPIVSDIFDVFELRTWLLEGCNPFRPAQFIAERTSTPLTHKLLGGEALTSTSAMKARETSSGTLGEVCGHGGFIISELKEERVSHGRAEVNVCFRGAMSYCRFAYSFSSIQIVSDSAWKINTRHYVKLVVESRSRFVIDHIVGEMPFNTPSDLTKL